MYRRVQRAICGLTGVVDIDTLVVQQLVFAWVYLLAGCIALLIAPPLAVVRAAVQVVTEVIDDLYFPLCIIIGLEPH